MRKNVVDDDEDVGPPLPAPEKEEKNPVKVEEAKGKKVNLYRCFYSISACARVSHVN